MNNEQIITYAIKTYDILDMVALQDWADSMTEGDMELAPINYVMELLTGEAEQGGFLRDVQ